MQKLRRSGSVACFFIEGKIPSPPGDAFTTALRAQRFRSIEDAASEEISAGWVSPQDPTGERFAIDEIDHDQALWLRIISPIPRNGARPRSFRSILATAPLDS